MVGRVAPIDATNLERCVQLINRSNQFNLTTRRYAAGEIAALMSNPDWLSFAVSLADRFGDNGLISVLLARVDGTDLVVDTWLMSCRVLKRDVEVFLLEQVLVAARRLGLRRIVGEYIPTAKNGLVREHFATLGFTCLSTAGEGQTTWELEVPTEKGAPKTHIELAS
jgi:FkbH-like protein